MTSRILPIPVVARETGISMDLLRKWEVRYGFPQPVRLKTGIRGYPLKQLEILRKVKRLMETGVRAGEAIRISVSGDGVMEAILLPPPPDQNTVSACLEAIRSHDIPALHSLLDRSLVSLGLYDFICRTAAPLTTAVGEAWLRGELRVHEEHFFSATLAAFLSEIHRRLHMAAGRPRVLLTTPPGELHTLGLDMVRVLLAESDAHCISLGAQTPLGEMAAAVTAYDAQILALSFSAAYPARLLLPTLTELRQLIAPEVSIWIGGAGTLTGSHLPAGVQAFVSVGDAVAALPRDNA